MRQRWFVLLVLSPTLFAGFLAMTCSENSNVCDEISCSSRGFCIEDQGTPYCACLRGYHPVGLACMANDSADPCAGIDCGGHGTCVAEESDVACECEDDYVWVADPASALCADAECDLVCVEASPPEGPCVAESCEAYCRRRWGGLHGVCFAEACLCLPDCDEAQCAEECRTAGFIGGHCDPVTGCTCSESGDADADADAEPDVGTEDGIDTPPDSPLDASADTDADADTVLDDTPPDDGLPDVPHSEAIDDGRPTPEAVDVVEPETK